MGCHWGWPVGWQQSKLLPCASKSDSSWLMEWGLHGTGGKGEAGVCGISVLKHLSNTFELFAPVAGTVQQTAAEGWLPKKHLLLMAVLSVLWLELLWGGHGL